MHQPKVYIAMSGGVDSSVAAALLKYAAKPDEFEKLTGRPAPQGLRGFDVYGIHIKMWSDPEIPCTDKQDRLDAMRVAAHLGIPFQTWNFTEKYRSKVVEYMIREYAAGRTPNPDIMCNRHIKFGLFLGRALEAGADYVATGHYARREPEFSISNSQFSNKRAGDLGIETYTLKAARDLNKDQTYFLWTLGQEQLRHCLFPIGEYAKPEVRELARKFGLLTADKPDSQGVCFIGEFDMREFLKRYIPERKGKVLTPAGQVVGEHAGIEFYTIGQRHGISFGGGIPYYVAEKDTKANTLTVAVGPYDENLFKRELIASDANWISGKAPTLPLRCSARIRYRQPLQRCKIQDLGFRNKDSLSVVFDEAQRAVTPGQSIVFYQGSEMIGGGVIL